MTDHNVQYPPSVGSTRVIFDRPGVGPEVSAVVLPTEGGPWQEKVTDLEQYMPTPRRKKAAVDVRDVASLIAYVKRHGASGTIGVILPSGDIRVVLDHHEPVSIPFVPSGTTTLTVGVGSSGSGAGGDGGTGVPLMLAPIVGNPGWREHSVKLTREYHKSFLAWKDADGETLTQDTFAEFIEDHISEIITPAGADLFDLVRFFESSQTIAFSSSISLRNGERQLKYIETLAGGGTSEGTREVPDKFTILMRPFKDSPVPAEGQPDRYQFPVEVRLRYRVGNGKVTFTFILPETIDDMLDAIFNEEAARVATECGITVLKGAAI